MYRHMLLKLGNDRGVEHVTPDYAESFYLQVA